MSKELDARLAALIERCDETDRLIADTRRLADLESENAKLREQLVRMELHECPACANVADLQDALAENEKLRELVRDVMPIVCDGCHERLCEMPKEEHPFVTCSFADRMRELGVEV